MSLAVTNESDVVATCPASVTLCSCRTAATESKVLSSTCGSRTPSKATHVPVLWDSKERHGVAKNCCFVHSGTIWNVGKFVRNYTASHSARQPWYLLSCGSVEWLHTAQSYMQEHAGVIQLGVLYILMMIPSLISRIWATLTRYSTALSATVFSVTITNELTILSSIPIRSNVMAVASKLDIFKMMCLQFWAPDDGRRNRLKHVEHWQ